MWKSGGSSSETELKLSGVASPNRGCEMATVFASVSLSEDRVHLAFIRFTHIVILMSSKQCFSQPLGRNPVRITTECHPDLSFGSPYNHTNAKSTDHTRGEILPLHLHPRFKTIHVKLTSLEVRLCVCMLWYLLHTEQRKSHSTMEARQLRTFLVLTMSKDCSRVRFKGEVRVELRLG